MLSMQTTGSEWSVSITNVRWQQTKVFALITVAPFVRMQSPIAAAIATENHLIIIMIIQWPDESFSEIESSGAHVASAWLCHDSSFSTAFSLHISPYFHVAFDCFMHASNYRETAKFPTQHIFSAQISNISRRTEMTFYALYHLFLFTECTFCKRF